MYFLLLLFEGFGGRRADVNQFRPAEGASELYRPWVIREQNLMQKLVSWTPESQFLDQFWINSGVQNGYPKSGHFERSKMGYLGSLYPGSKDPCIHEVRYWIPWDGAKGRQQSYGGSRSP